MAIYESKEDFEHLLLIAAGHTAFQLLWAGIELKLFDTLSSSPNLTLSEIADKLGLEYQPARILVVGLASIKLLTKEGNSYSNAPVTEQRLVTGKPDNIAPIMGWQRYIVYEGLTDFVTALKENKNIGLEHFPGEGNTLYQRLTNDPVKEKVFQDSMSSLSDKANSYLVDNIDLSEVKHIVDAGGGDGTNAITIAKKFPHIKVTIFDSASVCKIAEKNIAAEGLSDRVFTWPGNFFDDPFPADIDAVIYCHIMTIWSIDNIVRLLKRTYNALPDGGLALIFNMMGNDEDTGPISTALGSPYFLAIATGEGMLYSWSDYESALNQANFQQTQRIDDLPLDHGVLIGKK